MNRTPAQIEKLERENEEIILLKSPSDRQGEEHEENDIGALRPAACAHACDSRRRQILRFRAAKAGRCNGRR